MRADPHFERVWFPTGAENPTVRRVAGEFRVTFAKPGTYRGAFTVVGGHRTNDVYSMIVVVKPRPRQTASLAGTVADEIS